MLEKDPVEKSTEESKGTNSGHQDERSNEGFFSIFSGSGTPRQDKLKDEQDLKMAKLWSRVDQLASDQSRLRERLRVIEKGLTLGLIPEELKDDHKGHKIDPKMENHQNHKDTSEVELLKSPEVIEETPGKAEKGENETPTTLSQDDSEKAYQAAMAFAHEQFRAGAYGRAIVEYEGIGKKFGDKFGSGSHKFWVARCWINMKEYATARQILAEFLKDYPGSTWAPRGKLELSRVEWKLGLRETSLSRLRDIIRDHPQEDAAEMAKMELSSLDKTL